jgi:hypothetical protein
MSRTTYQGKGSNVERTATSGSLGVMSENKRYWENYASKDSFGSYRADPNAVPRNTYEPTGTNGDYRGDHVHHPHIRGHHGTMGGVDRSPYPHRDAPADPHNFLAEARGNPNAGAGTATGVGRTREFHHYRQRGK